jgi:hypothetical protein
MKIKRIDGQSAMKHALNGALFTASICTFFDYLWKAWIPDEHAMIYGLLHGALLFACLGAFIGALKKSGKTVLMGMVGGIVSGFAAAAGFYFVYFPLLSHLMPRKHAYLLAMIVSWITIWKLLANLTAMLNGEGFRPFPSGVRGFIASVVSVPGFLLITHLWSDPDSYNYILAFLGWTFAFFAALMALLYRRPKTGDPDQWI